MPSIPSFHSAGICWGTQPCAKNCTGSTLVYKAYSSYFYWIISFFFFQGLCYFPIVQTELRHPHSSPPPCHRNIEKCSWQTAGRSLTWMSGQLQSTYRIELNDQLSWSELLSAALRCFPWCPPQSLYFHSFCRHYYLPLCWILWNANSITTPKGPELVLMNPINPARCWDILRLLLTPLENWTHIIVQMSTKWSWAIAALPFVK